MTNCNHDLIHQLSEKLDSVWRYEQYTKNAQVECLDCVGLWKELKKQDEEMCEKIRQRIIEHVKAEKFE